MAARRADHKDKVSSCLGPPQHNRTKHVTISDPCSTRRTGRSAPRSCCRRAWPPRTDGSAGCGAPRSRRREREELDQANVSITRSQAKGRPPTPLPTTFTQLPLPSSSIQFNNNLHLIPIFLHNSQQLTFIPVRPYTLLNFNSHRCSPFYCHQTRTLSR